MIIVLCLCINVIFSFSSLSISCCLVLCIVLYLYIIVCIFQLYVNPKNIIGEAINSVSNSVSTVVLCVQAPLHMIMLA